MVEITLALAFLAGLISFLSPCVMPLIPAYLTFLAGTTAKDVQDKVEGVRKRIFLSSVFFVLGFGVVFSLIGVLLQSVLSSIAFDVQRYLGYVGGAVIILFGLILIGVLKIPFLQAEHKLSVKKTRFQYLTSFIFGAAFAVGWTPCVGAVLGGVLTLAATQPGVAFPLMLAYSLGLGLPFLLAGAFFSRTTGIIQWLGPYLKIINVFFGIVLVILGILVFTDSLSQIANLLIPAQLLGAEQAILGE
ncbi:cytochrome c biogenesis protein CcdA [Candidatus Micrarchaeota archaeon]|nr:cytochrome c biogenesis protein CcdA [Candidatus Micrarchaeota archaeon]